MYRIHLLSNGFNETIDIRIWSGNNNKINGFVFYLSPDSNPEFFIRPELYGSRIAEEMIAWAVERAAGDDTSSPLCPPPDGYSIVSNIDFPEIASIARENITHEQYEYICNAPGYKNDLGLRVCYQNQEIVSGCICWYDDIDNCGEFEPVGTKEKHRNKGLALAVMAKTMQNLKKYGANTVK